LMACHHGVGLANGRSLIPSMVTAAEAEGSGYGSDL